MRITIKETGKTYDVKLILWDGTQYGPDCFDDLEPNFPREHETLEGDYAVLSNQADFDNLVEWWTAETDAANRGEDGDGLCGLTESERENGYEWAFLVEEI